MYLRKLIPTLAILCFSAVGVANNLSTESLGFGAPLVDNTNRVRYPESGNIVYDLSTSTFYGYTHGANRTWIGLGSAPSEVFVYSGNGMGSTNAVIRRFSVISKNIGGAITYVDSATNGASFTINETGIYAITYVDRDDNNMIHGVSVNSTELTTDVYFINPSTRAVISAVSGPSAVATNAVVTLNLNQGDVVRPHTNGAQNSTSDHVSFRITKIR